MISPATLAVELRGVSVRRGGVTLLDEINLAVEPGRSCGVVGANGSGKSALLRVVAGLVRPSRGEARVEGLNVLEHPTRSRRVIGYAGDEDGLAERMTPVEHLQMVAAERGLGRADRRDASESMLELVDLAPQRDAPIRSLSRGQRRRLALALSLVHDPPIVLLDEPMSGIDETGRSELASILLELRSMGKTLLIASQSTADVAETCDVVATLVHGRLDSPPATASETAILTWIELVGDAEPALRVLREHPGVDDAREEGGFVTFRGPTSADDRAQVLDVLVKSGVRLAGFGATSTPLGGRSA